MTRSHLVLTALLLTGCSAGGTATVSSSPPPVTSAAPSTAGGQAAVPAERNPPGDIPDNIAFVPYTNTTGRYTFAHPEGWSETTKGATVIFTDKLNGVQARTGTTAVAPTAQSAKSQDVPALKSSQAAFELRDVQAVTLPAGTGVKIVYRRNSAPDPVTGRQYRDEVQRYEIVANGREVVVELFGPVGADNVDAYRSMIQSLRFS